MLEIMLMTFILTSKCFNYKAECSSHHAENTFLCMRQNPRGPTPSMTGSGTKKVTYKTPVSKKRSTFCGNPPISIGLGI